MSFVSLISFYLNLNLLLMVGFCSLSLMIYLFRKYSSLSSANELRWHYRVVVLIFGFAILQPILPKQKVFTPVAKVWSAPSIASPTTFKATESRGYLSFTPDQQKEMIPARPVILILSFLALLGFLFSVYFFVRDFLKLQRLQKTSFLVRQIHRVCILVHDQTQVPFSYVGLRKAYVVMPSALLFQPQPYKMALMHEIQHHRQRDTQWVYILFGLRWFCAINPAVYFWNRWITEVQEFACDETLVDQKKVESQAYARCLVEVAQNAVVQKWAPVCATGFLFKSKRHMINRRIEKMFLQSSTQGNKKWQKFVGLILVTLIGMTTYASTGLIQDRRISLEQAQRMAQRAQENSSFPVVVNDLVLKQLNRYLGTLEGREYMKNALARMENHRPLIEGLQKKYGVPAEVLALPITESGYQNLPESQNSHWPEWDAAGIWQFIRGTAKNFGLNVNAHQDDRLNVPLETDAAMRYLQANHLRFKDWQLAIMAYNMGENALQKGIDTLGNRNAWSLIRHGHEGDKNYLAKVMAAILIMKNPESVQN